MNDPVFISTDDAARMLGVTRMTLCRWRSHGVGPTYLGLGSLIAYRRADVEAWHNDPNNDRPVMGRPRKAEPNG